MVVITGAAVVAPAVIPAVALVPEGAATGAAALGAAAGATTAAAGAAGAAAGAAASGAAVGAIGGAAGAAATGGAIGVGTIGGAAAGAAAGAAGTMGPAAATGALVGMSNPIGWILLGHTDDTTHGVSWNCWKKVIHDRSNTHGGMRLDHLLNHPNVIQGYESYDNNLYVINKWGEKFKITYVQLPNGGLAAHAQICN